MSSEFMYVSTASAGNLAHCKCHGRCFCARKPIKTTALLLAFRSCDLKIHVVTVLILQRFGSMQDAKGNKDVGISRRTRQELWVFF